MRTLAIAIGNILRGDDGVAHAAVGLLKQMETRACMQLTPELAPEISNYDAVIFLDADPQAARPSLQPLDESPQPSSLTHVSSPAEIVALARSLYGFTGRAFVCGIPAADFSAGHRLTPRAHSAARQAARMIGDRWPLSF